MPDATAVERQDKIDRVLHLLGLFHVRLPVGFVAIGSTVQHSNTPIPRLWLGFLARWGGGGR